MALSRRNFLSKTEAELTIWLSDVESEILQGKTRIQNSAGDTNFQYWKDLVLSAERRRDLILNDLSILNPTAYPPRDLARVRRTVPQYIE